MGYWQNIFLIFYSIFSFVGFLKGLKESKDKKNAFGLSRIYLPLGAFVWGDTVVFGLFWTLVTVIILILQDWILFLLIISVFWVIRSFGEAIYWFNQQFSTINRNPPEKLPGYNIFRNDSIWFVHQILWQCVTVLSIIAVIYFSKIWF